MQAPGDPDPMREIARRRFRLLAIVSVCLVGAAVTFPFVEALPPGARTALAAIALVAAVVVQVQALWAWRSGGHAS